MIVLPHEQGTTDWLRARMGIPTASRFDSILTPKQRKASSSQEKFLCELLAERLMGTTFDSGGTDWMQRGTELEARAVAAYEFDRDVEVVKVGLCLDDSRRWGASPDRLVGERGLSEFKCVSAPNHIMALRGLRDDDHMSQCQGQMLVTEREWVDLVFYNPALPMHIVRIVRHEDYITDLRGELVKFCEKLDSAEKSLRAQYGAQFAQFGSGASGLTLHKDVPGAAA